MMGADTPQDWAVILRGDLGRDEHGQPVIRCPGPGHTADDRSLSVWLDRDAPQGFRVDSFAGDPFEACRDYVVLTVGLPPWKPEHKANTRANGHTKPPRQVVAHYVYTDPEGAPRLRVTRYTPKGFAQARPDGKGDWEPGGIQAAQKVPFKLPEIIEAIGLGRTVYVTEGEKAALALWAKGLPATCSSGGAGKWPEHHAQWFKGATVVVLPDHDGPGRKHGEQVLTNLLPVAASVRVVNLPGLPAGGDVVDWLLAGNDVEAILAMANDRHDEAAVGTVILDAICAFASRFVAYPDEAARDAHVLWIAHTHLMECWVSTPRLAPLSPEPASGKTRALEVTELLVPRPMLAVEFSPAYLFRKISDDAGLPTILHDEVDAVFAGRAPQHEELRALYNSGHRRGAYVGRVSMQGKKAVLEEFPAFCAVALAGLGDLPETLMSRSVILRMRRRAPGEKVEPFRRRLVEGEAEQLRDSLAAWAASVSGSLADYAPNMPPGVEDRGADCWEPLIAVADAAGGAWPRRARVAAVTFVSRSPEENQSLGVRLLGDLREVFGGADQMFTEDILAALNRLDESPWGDLKGKPLDARGLARMLRRYGIRSVTVRFGPKTAKGYVRAALHDAWARYAPSTPENSVTSGTGDTGADP